MLVVSTDEVYGQGDPATVSSTRRADTAPEPVRREQGGCRAIGPRVCDHVRRRREVVRGTNAFGPRQNPEKAIPVFTMAALEGRQIPVYAEGGQRREWLYVTDWAAACMIALRPWRAG